MTTAAVRTLRLWAVAALGMGIWPGYYPALIADFSAGQFDLIAAPAAPP